MGDTWKSGSHLRLGFAVSRELWVLRVKILPKFQVATLVKSLSLILCVELLAFFLFCFLFSEVDLETEIRSQELTVVLFLCLDEIKRLKFILVDCEQLRLDSESQQVRVNQRLPFFFFLVQLSDHRILRSSFLVNLRRLYAISSVIFVHYFSQLLPMVPVKLLSDSLVRLLHFRKDFRLPCQVESPVISGHFVVFELAQSPVNF